MSQSVENVADVPCFTCLIEDKYKISYHRCNPERCIKMDAWLKALNRKKDEKP